MAINGQAVLENVRRYRTVASLYRQTATFRPHQRLSLLEQAQLWEERAVSELKDYFVARDAARSASRLSSIGLCPGTLGNGRGLERTPTSGRFARNSWSRAIAARRSSRSSHRLPDHRDCGSITRCATPPSGSMTPLPRPPDGWFDYGYAALWNGELALLRTDYDYYAALAQQKGEGAQGDDQQQDMTQRGSAAVERLRRDQRVRRSRCRPAAGPWPIAFRTGDGCYRNTLNDDCYALTVDGATVWSYFGAGYPIIRIERGVVRRWRNEITHASAIAVDGDHVLLAGGHGENRSRLSLLQLGAMRFTRSVCGHFVGRIRRQRSCCRGAGRPCT